MTFVPPPLGPSTVYRTLNTQLGRRGRRAWLSTDDDYHALLYDALPLDVTAEDGRLTVRITEDDDDHGVGITARLAAHGTGPDALKLAAELIDQHARRVLPSEYVQRFDEAFDTAPLG
jgi:hypothetical protein